MNEKKVRIETSDRELYEMIALWLCDEGYEVAEAEFAETPDLYIIDTETASKEERKGAKVLYITDVENGENSVARPFSRLEFIGAVRKMCGGLEHSVRVDHKRRRIYNKKAYVTLTDKEYAVFRLLYERMGTAVSRDDISLIARGSDQKTNAADVYICMLRRKLTELLGENPIKTVRGHGYVLSHDIK